MRAGPFRAFLALVPLIGALNGCATTRDIDVWISESEPRTWAAHSVEVAAATVASDLITDSPWWGYAFMMGAQVGWEIQEARLTDWDVPWWGTAMDLLAPAVTGFLVGRWLDGRKKKSDRPEPVFQDGETADGAEDTENRPESQSSPNRQDATQGRSTVQAEGPNAGHLFRVYRSPLLEWPRP